MTSLPLLRAYALRAGAQERDLTQVECGQTFYLEVQALDRFSNKWAWEGGTGAAG